MKLDWKSTKDNQPEPGKVYMIWPQAVICRAGTEVMMATDYSGAWQLSEITHFAEIEGPE